MCKISDKINGHIKNCQYGLNCFVFQLTIDIGRGFVIFLESYKIEVSSGRVELYNKRGQKN